MATQTRVIATRCRLPILGLRQTMKLFFSQTATVLALAMGCLSLGAPSVQATPITVTGAGLGQSIPLIVNGSAQNSYSGQILITMLGQSYVT